MKITGPFRKGKSEDELSQMEPATWAAVAEYIEEGVRDFEKEKGLSPVYIRHWRGTPLVDADILLVYETLYPGAADRIMALAEKAQSRTHRKGIARLSE
jgi:uncharacterized membrane protein